MIKCVTCGLPFESEEVVLGGRAIQAIEHEGILYYRDCQDCRLPGFVRPGFVPDTRKAVVEAQSEARRVALDGLRKLLRIEREACEYPTTTRFLEGRCAGLEFAIETIDSLLAEDAPKADTEDRRNPEVSPK